MLWSLVLQSWKDFMSSLTEPRGEWALQWVPVQVRETFLRTWVRKIRETPLPLIWCGYSCSGKGVFYRNSKLFTFQRKGKGKKKKKKFQNCIATSFGMKWISLSSGDLCWALPSHRDDLSGTSVCVCIFPNSYIRWVPVFYAASFWASSCSKLCINAFFNQLLQYAVECLPHTFFLGKLSLFSPSEICKELRWNGTHIKACSVCVSSKQIFFSV